MYLLRIGAIEGFAALVKRYQQNPAALMAEVGLSPAQLREPDALVSYNRMADLLDLSSQRCQAPFFSLDLTASQTPQIFGELALFTSQQTSIGALLQASQRYLHLHAMGINLEVTSEETLTEFSLSFDFTNDYQLHQLIQLSAGHMWNMLVAAVGGIEDGLSLHLRQPAETKLPPAPYTDRIVFNSHFNGIQFPTRWLERSANTYETEVRDYFERRMQQLENLYPDNLQAQARYIISNLLASGECTLERVSASLNLHPRALQRKLSGDQTSFRHLLQQCRQKHAEHYLRHTHISITDLALNLGYAEVAVFSRHFKQWTGLSPRAWQQQAKGSTT